MYRPLYSLRVEHDYFDGNTCRAFRCRIPASAGALWRRRGVLFRQIEVNEWTVLYDDAGAGMDPLSDVLVLELEIADPAFVWYTRWEDFRPGSAYLLELPEGGGALDAALAVVEAAPKRGIGSGFCRLRLRPTEEVVRAAGAGTSKLCRLQFRAPERQWEYLFIPCDGREVSVEKLRLEELGGKLEFTPFEAVNEYGYRVLRTVSREPIPLREHYDERLRLTLATVGAHRSGQILLKQVPLPEPGVYLSPERELLRQISYF